jgi:predicted peroxiredoxin
MIKMAGKFCVSIANCHKDPDKVTVGFVVANAALGSEKETMVFLSTDGVWAAQKGEADKIRVGEPFAPLKELIGKFVAGGGHILVCNPCMKLRGISPEDLIEGAVPAGGAALVEFLSQPGAASVSY